MCESKGILIRTKFEAFIATKSKFFSEQIMKGRKLLRLTML